MGKTTEDTQGTVISYLNCAELGSYGYVCAPKVPQVSVQVFQHSVLVLNCLEYHLHHVLAVAIAMWRVRTCTNTSSSDHLCTII